MRILSLLAIAASYGVSALNLTGQGETLPALSGDQVVERVSPSAVSILVGKGDGQVAGVASGVIFRSDGVILTANHVVKGMREVQVRLKSGEVYDQVELLGSDERRDVAALRITAAGLPVLPLGNSASSPSGATVFVVSNAVGLPWTASSGILSATRLADDVPGAGSGYRILQFTAPLAPGSSGGVLVDAQARMLGIVVGSFSVGQNVNFAVPIDSIAGLANPPGGTRFDSAARLQSFGARAASTVAAPSNAPGLAPVTPPSFTLPRPDQRQIHSISVHSKTIYLRRERLQDDIHKTAMFPQLGLRFADYGQAADIEIIVDRPVMTFDWTYTLVYQPRSLTLASGTVEGTDEFDAGPKLAAAIVEQLASAVQLSRAELDKPTGTSARGTTVLHAAASDPDEIVRAAQSIFVESHTIWMKGNLLQDALYVRPEIREWNMRIVDNRNEADIYIDVTRPFLTYDWIFKMISPKTGMVLGTGKVTAIDGPAAAQRLAIDIVKRIRSARPASPPSSP
jgi:Trypsin-like peptidase domain